MSLNSTHRRLPSLFSSSHQAYLEQVTDHLKQVAMGTNIKVVPIQQKSLLRAKRLFKMTLETYDDEWRVLDHTRVAKTTKIMSHKLQHGLLRLRGAIPGRWCWRMSRRGCRLRGKGRAPDRCDHVARPHVTWTVAFIVQESNQCDILGSAHTCLASLRKPEFNIPTRTSYLVVMSRSAICSHLFRYNKLILVY
ncbi:hypothetical protein Ccrd_003828 [Cynara cardunculus var. scolymus]|uniref:Uncharacterized protein n=1 Tax=Cynara cardunculus var. scolymus TaxID=59895 RepID=A0A103XP39_CYNCS|nr:hypothetical protein Ccrd_003828 [Cynara cardunculus var. scolymus]